MFREQTADFPIAIVFRGERGDMNYLTGPFCHVTDDTDDVSKYFHLPTWTSMVVFDLFIPSDP